MITSTVIAGSSAGAKPAKDAISFWLEYTLSFLSIF
jgi:hypothetical protein